MKKLIRLTESDLHNIIKESVNRVLRENAELDNGGPYYLYVNYDCVGEYDNYNDAKNEAIRYHKKYPDAIIADVLMTIQMKILYLGLEVN